MEGGSHSGSGGLSSYRSSGHAGVTLQMSTDWQSTKAPPPDSKVVMTKIDDAQGCRNEQALMRKGNLWYTPDSSMYVYYTPTHWRPLTAAEAMYERQLCLSKAAALERQAEALRKKTFEI